AGAIPKDGPSAGVAIAISLLSLATGPPVRHDVAVTGEITLRARVMPVGGIEERLLAALRSEVNEDINPYENKKDLAKLPAIARRRLRIHTVRTLDEAVAIALRVGPRARGKVESARAAAGGIDTTG